jgi:hypothetical protein
MPQDTEKLFDGQSQRASGMYKQRPIDTSYGKLPETMVHLTERLAENNHDLWAQQRMAESWTYGRRRDRPRGTPGPAWRETPL